MTDVPVVVTAAGAQPTPPAVLRAELVAGVASKNPGYTSNLPASLVEDVASTQVGGLAQIDSATVESINSLTPYGANDFVLSQLGQIYIGPGAAPAPPTNTSVEVVFTVVDASSNPVPGYVIPVGFTVSDGTYQYVVQDGGVTDSTGVTESLFCTSPTSGSWPVATNTVAQIITSVPAPYVMTCTNPTTGVSGDDAETSEEFRARVLQAGQAISTGTPQLLKTLLAQVTGVQQRLISVRASGGDWEVIVGGGDPYLVAGEIFASGLNIQTLTGSTLAVTNVTQANPAVVTTDLNHLFTTGQVAQINGMTGMGPLNGVPFTVTVISEKVFSIGINTSGYPAYVSGGVVTPNLRNEAPSIIDYPDTYAIPFVRPPQQTVTIAVGWNTTQINFVSQAAVSQLASTAIAAYVNSIPVGSPISLIELATVFAASVSSVIDPSVISSLTFAVSINGVATAPTGQLVIGDPESYFAAAVGGIVVTQS